MFSGGWVDLVGGLEISMGWRYAGFTSSVIGVSLLFFGFIFVISCIHNFHSQSSNVYING